MTSVNLLTAVMLVTIAVGTTASLLAWRERPEPGATPLVAMLAGQTWWSAFFVFELEATGLGAKILWSNVQWIGVVVIPVAWLLFALEYTGRDRFVRWPYVALLSIVPAVTVLLAMTGEFHDLLYVESHLVRKSGMAILSRTGGPWFWVITGYTYFLGLLGTIPLLGLVQSDAIPFRGQSAALLLGTMAPWASNALFLAGAVPIPGLDPTPIAFMVSGVCYLGALTRFRLFGTSPSPNQRARRLVFERMQEGAVVVDSHDYLVDMNQSAAEILGAIPHEALGSPASEYIPQYATLPSHGSTSEPITIPTETGEQPYDVTVTEITDFHGRTIGRVITFHDISEYLRQQQRLQVLNRVLRHNIRTETNLIHGYADFLGDEDGTENERVETVKEHAMRIEEIGEKAREISAIFQRRREEPTPTPLAELLDRSVASVREEFPEVSIDREPVPDTIHVAGVLDAVFANLIENAAEHNTSDDPQVRIEIERVAHGGGRGEQAADDDRSVEPTAESDGHGEPVTRGDVEPVVRDGGDVERDGERTERIRVTVVDNGPGIDDYERSVLERGTETPLEHGSGLGLWLVIWGTDVAGGEVAFGENDPTGTAVTVEVPVLSPAQRAGPRD